MTDLLTTTSAQEEIQENLQARLVNLERESRENRRQNEQRVVLAELKVEAMRADMIDMDGLQFLDMTQVHIDEEGNISGGTELIAKLKRAKPWLFSAPSSSSVANVPRSNATRQKHVRDMSDDEYRSARETVIRRSAF